MKMLTYTQEEIEEVIKCGYLKIIMTGWILESELFVET